MDTLSPFHPGEQRAQARAGVRDAVEPWARQVVRPELPQQHQDFFSRLPYLVAAARDGRGRPWVTLLTGPRGFVTIPDPRRMRIDSQPGSGDPLEGALRPGSPLGLLGIDLATRRRNRVNGRVGDGDALGFELAVDQSFGNCPQHIHVRHSQPVEAAGAEPVSTRGDRLDAALRRLVEGADTLFIATGHDGDGIRPQEGMDASHRGGDPGFVEVVDARTLVIPDLAGNNYFNTVGNLELDPRAGLLFLDFERGTTLQLTGRATVSWDVSSARYPGAQRLIRFHIDEAVRVDAALPLRFRRPVGALRALRVTRRVQENDEVVSLHLEAEDGGPLPTFRPGQHLPLSVELPGQERGLRRTYSLSGDPAEPGYRISVKRVDGGRISGHLHRSVVPGSRLWAEAPAGDFVLPSGDRPVMLLGAGVGATPLLSMLHALARPGQARRVWYVHSVRDEARRLFVDEVNALAARRSGIGVNITLSQPSSEHAARVHGSGRLDARAVLALPGAMEAEVLLCGPPGFMAALSDGLVARGIPRERIHWESFGG